MSTTRFSPKPHVLDELDRAYSQLRFLQLSILGIQTADCDPTPEEYQGLYQSFRDPIDTLKSVIEDLQAQRQKKEVA